MSGTLIGHDELMVLVIDVQERLAAAMPDPAPVTAAVARLVRCAGIVGAPVMVTRQYPAGLGDTVEPVREALSTCEQVSVFDKTAFCACREEGFTDALTALHRPQVAVVGMESHICVTQTALSLRAAGLDVHVVEDGCCSRSPRDHATVMARLASAGVTVTTTESVMYEAVGRAGTDEFRRLLAVVKAG